MDRRILEWLGLAARLVTGGVWLWAGALKLPDPGQSVVAVRAYDMLPESIVPAVGQLLPVLEVVVGACLVLGLLTRGAAVVSAVLLGFFIVGISQAWARGLQIDCGCFGGGGYDPNASDKYPWEIARDVGLLVASLFLLWLGRTRWALDGLVFRRTPAPLGPVDDAEVTDTHTDTHTDTGDIRPHLIEGS